VESANLGRTSRFGLEVGPEKPAAKVTVMACIQGRFDHDEPGLMTYRAPESRMAIIVWTPATPRDRHGESECERNGGY